MGSKTAARTLAVANGVPVVPGTTEPLENAKEAEKIAKKFGYPVLLKAAAGGGGKGMRVVAGPKDLAGAPDAARREAKSAVGADAVDLRKFVVPPRHFRLQNIGRRPCNLRSLRRSR